MNPIVQIIVIVALVFIAVVLLLKPMSRADEEANARLDEIRRGVRRPPKESKLKKLLSKPKDGSMPVSWTVMAAEAVNSFIRPGNRNQPLTKTDKEIKKLLAVANINISMATFTFFRLAIGILTAAIVFVLGNLLAEYVTTMQLLFASFVGFLGGTLLPKAILRSSANKRRTAIVASLTDTIDLIAISVEAGLGYDAAIMNIWQKNKSPAMQELVRTINDVNYGMSRHDAYQSLAARCDVDEMSLFANNMAQADAMGIPIVNVLKTQADALRVARRRRAETQIQKAPVKMLLPLVLFVFPTMLVILIGPAVINFMRYF